MALKDTFQAVLDSLPDDWTDLELDLRIHDEHRYIDAASYMTVCNAQPYSQHDWHWRLLVAHRAGHAAPWQSVLMALGLLDDAGITGELEVREVREGRLETTYLPNRPESVRQEYFRLHNF
jgi:L-rhamnose isomerase